MWLLVVLRLVVSRLSLTTTSGFETNILKEVFLGTNVGFNVENIYVEGPKQGFVASNSKADYNKEETNFTFQQ